MGLGQYDEAKECYESLRSLGKTVSADCYLKKLDETKENKSKPFCTKQAAKPKKKNKKNRNRKWKIINRSTYLLVQNHDLIDLVDPDETQVATADSDVKPRKIAKVQKVDKIEEEKENEGEEGEKKDGEEKEAPGEYRAGF